MDKYFRIDYDFRLWQEHYNSHLLNLYNILGVKYDDKRYDKFCHFVYDQTSDRKVKYNLNDDFTY